MKQSDRELRERLTKALTTINKNYTPLAVSPASIEAIDENWESPGHIWLCVGGWGRINPHKTRNPSQIKQVFSC